MKAFLTFLHVTKSIYVSYDNILMKMISERSDFILDQCALYSKEIFVLGRWHAGKQVCHYLPFGLL